jgi:hypothetical protein
MKNSNKDRILLTSKKTPRRKFHFWVSVIFAFVLIYQPPLPVSVVYLICIISVIFLTIQGRILQRHMVGLAVLLAAFWYLLLISLLNGQDISGVSHVFWLAVAIYPACIVFYIYNKDQNFDYLFHVILCAALIQAAIAYASLFFEDFRVLISKLMIETGLYTQDHLDSFGYRIYGYGTSLMYAIPIVQSIIAAWTVMYSDLNNKILYFILGILLFISAVINAKVALFSFTAVLFVGIFVGRNGFGKRIFRIMIAACIVVLIFPKLFSALQIYNKELYDWVNILFNRNLVQKWYVDYYSDLSRLSLPESALGFIFGTGASKEAWGYNVDMGFVNDIWLGGILYFIFTVAVIVYCTKKIRNSRVLLKPWNNILAFSFIPVFIIADIKGIVFNYSAFMALLLLITIFTSKREV